MSYYLPSKTKQNKNAHDVSVCVFFNKPEEIFTLRAVVSPDRTLRYVSLPAWRSVWPRETTVRRVSKQRSGIHAAPFPDTR